MSTVYCIGNPLVDYITDADDELLASFELDKGNFHLVSRDKAMAVLAAVSDRESKIVPGGAAANTACGVSRMGGEASLCGGIGNDEFGKVFTNALMEAGVEPRLGIYDDATGFVIALVTPDAERTFMVYLGGSLLLDESALDYNVLRNSNFLYFTGYQYEDPGLRKVITAAAEFSKTTVTRVAMDLADPGLVTRNRDGLTAFIDEYVDIVFANEEEGKAYTGKEGDACLADLAKGTEYGILKLGAEGALISNRNAVEVVQACPCQAIDTTGAGDMFAAGILFGLDRGFSLEYTGKLAAYAASLVISQKGGRLDRNIVKDIENL